MSHGITTYSHADKVRTKTSSRDDLISGALAGQIAGLLMAVVVMAVFTIFLGKGPLYPVQVIGSFVFGDEAIAGFHFGALLTGLLLHQLGPSLAWGSIFGLLVNRIDVRSRSALIVLGVAIGLASQIVDVELLLPPLMNALHGHDIWAEQVPSFWSWAAHVVFGLGLAVFPWVSARVSRSV
jgi:hypothetical protein